MKILNDASVYPGCDVDESGEDGELFKSKGRQFTGSLKFMVQPRLSYLSGSVLSTVNSTAQSAINP